MATTKRSKGYTVKDYMEWPDYQRCELIHGLIYNMSPAPGLVHQRALGILHVELQNALSELRKTSLDNQCEVFVAPVDVVLAQDTVVQPDLVAVCDRAKLANGKYIQGPPDLVVEVVSPATVLKDKREKRELYERSAVQEYLILDPLERYAEYYRYTSAGRYDYPLVIGPEDALPLLLLPLPNRTLGDMLGWSKELI